MLGFGLWWLRRAEAAARRAGEGYGRDASISRRRAAGRPDRARARHDRPRVRSRRDPARPPQRHPAAGRWLAVLPLIVVIGVNLLMAMVVLPRLDVSFLAEERWGATSLSAVGGVWAVAVALAAAILTLIADQPAAPAGAAREHGCRRQCFRAARASASRAWSGSARSSPRCRHSRWCATGCCRSAAGRSSRWPSPPTCSRL